MSFELIAGVGAGIVVCCAIAVTGLIVRAPVREDYPDDDSKMQRILIAAAHHRDQLDACYEDALHLHGFEKDSFGGDMLLSVIYDGDDYQDAMDLIEERNIDADF